jgi:serpin B
MRRIARLVLFLVTSICAGPAAIGQEAKMESVVEGNSQFALDLYGELKSQPGNLFFSPNSISTALAMTYAGARGQTADQMSRVLHFPAPQDKLPEAFEALRKMFQTEIETRGYHLSVANRLWGQQGYHFLPDFLAVTRDSYHAELAQVDFVRDPEGARDLINQWVEAQTREKIKDLVPSGVLTPVTRLVLTNAIYFKGDWTRPFPKQATREEDFHVSSDKTTRAPLMHKTDDFRFGALDGLKILDLPYGKGDVSTIVLLPDQNDGLTTLEGKLNQKNLTRWLSTLGSRKVEVTMPRFKLTSTFSLSDTLKAIGMSLAFDQDRADFSGMSTQEKLYISAVLHKAFVDFNEEGTEAAAATGVAMTKRAAIRPVPPAVFRADHPFLFLIVDNRSKSILFMGRVVNPVG